MQRQAQALCGRVLGNGSGLNMTNEIDRDNEDWLSTLSGEPRQEADAFTNAQAQSIRVALQRRATAVEQEAPEPSEAGYHRLLFRLKREGYIGPEAEKKLIAKHTAANDSDSAQTRTGTFDGIMFRRSSREKAQSPMGAAVRHSWLNPALGMAAVFVIGAALVFYMQVSGHKDEDPFAVRGGVATVLIVPDQNEKVIYLVDALNQLGGGVKIVREADGSVTLIVNANDQVLLRLAEERIHPEVKDGLIKLSIVPQPPK